MGFGGISPWSLLIILVIVLVLFGTKRLRNAGGDLGGAIKNFKKSMSDGQKSGEEKATEVADAVKREIKQDGGRVIDTEAEVKQDKKA